MNEDGIICTEVSSGGYLVGIEDTRNPGDVPAFVLQLPWSFTAVHLTGIRLHWVFTFHR